MADTTSTSGRDSQRSSSVVHAPGCLLRLLWIALGPIFLVFIATRIYASRSFSLLDLAYWTTFAAILTARYVDIHHFAGTTASGEPATPQHFYRYACGIAAAALLLCALVHLPSLMGLLSHER